MSDFATAKVTDCTGMTTVLVRAAARGEAAAGMDVPLGHAVRNGHGALVVHATPETWMVLSPHEPAGAVIRRLSPIAAAEFVSVIDLTHGYALIRVSGAAATFVLETLCAIDLSTAPDGAAIRTIVAGVSTTVIRDDEGAVVSYLLQCERSYGRYLEDTLIDAASG